MSKVFLWSVPGGSPCEIEKILTHHENVKMVREPFAKPYYNGPERLSTRFIDISPDENCSHEEAMLSITENQQQDEILFCIDYARHIKYHFELLLHPRYQDFQHVFLIRDPIKAIPCFHTSMTNSSMKFDVSECHYKDIYELYTFVRSFSQKPPLVLDADHMKMKTAEYAKALFSMINIPLTDGVKHLLSMYGNITIRRDKDNNKNTFESNENKNLRRSLRHEVPQFLHEIVKENWQYYKLMKKQV